MARPCGSLKATLEFDLASSNGKTWKWGVGWGVCIIRSVILSFQKVIVAILGRTNWRGGCRRARSTWKSPGKEAVTVGTGEGKKQKDS